MAAAAAAATPPPTPSAPRPQMAAAAAAAAAAKAADSTSAAIDAAFEAISGEQRELRAALSPSPAAARRTAPPPEPRTVGEPSRRRGDGTMTAPPAVVRPAPAAAGPPSAAVAKIDPDATAKLPSSSVPLFGAPAATPASSFPPPAAPVVPTAAPAPLATPATQLGLPSAEAPLIIAATRARASVPDADDESSVLAAPLTLDPSMLPEPPVVAMAPPSRPVSTSQRLRAPSAYEFEPPPTRIVRGEGLADRPFTPPRVVPVPEIPEPGLVPAARYLLRFARARFQRGTAIKKLGEEIQQDTAALDQVLGSLGRLARSIQLEGRVFLAENNAITAAEQRMAQLDRERLELDGRKAEEGSRFADVEKDRNSKLSEAERAVEENQRELGNLETQRRSLRDRRKELERKQRGFLKSAEERDEQAGTTEDAEARNELRRSAESHRREAADLEPDRQELDRKLSQIEKPIVETAAKLDAAKAELDAAKRSLNDAREGYGHRLAELDAEQKRKSRDVALSEAEVARRLVTLGTLVNLNRIEDPRFGELYERIDRLRSAITARSTEIEKLTAEREAYDRGSITRGATVIGGAIVALIALIVLLRALF
jgi:hypothetical protein